MSDKPAQTDKKPRKLYLTLLFTVYALCYGVLLVFLTVQLGVASGAVAAFFTSMLYGGIFGLVAGSLATVTAMITYSLYMLGMLGYMLVWGIFTGLMMTQLRLRRNLKHILTAMLISFVCSYIATILFALFLSKDVEMLFTSYFNEITAFSLLNAFAVIPFGLVFLPSESGYKREREIAVKTVKAGIHAGQVIFEHATEKKRRFFLPLVDFADFRFGRHTDFPDLHLPDAAGLRLPRHTSLERTLYPDDFLWLCRHGGKRFDGNADASAQRPKRHFELSCPIVCLLRRYGLSAAHQESRFEPLRPFAQPVLAAGGLADIGRRLHLAVV